MIRLRQKSEKKHEQSASNNKKKSDSTDETTNIAAEMTCAFKSVSNSKKNKKNVKKNIKNILLSDFFNVINDIVSHEERMLIMTTNYFEKLDKILIYSEKVNFQIEF